MSIGLAPLLLISQRAVVVLGDPLVDRGEEGVELVLLIEGVHVAGAELGPDRRLVEHASEELVALAILLGEFLVADAPSPRANCRLTGRGS